MCRCRQTMMATAKPTLPSGDLQRAAGSSSIARTAQSPRSIGAAMATCRLWSSTDSLLRGKAYKEILIGFTAQIVDAGTRLSPVLRTGTLDLATQPDADALGFMLPPAARVQLRYFNIRA